MAFQMDLKSDMGMEFKNTYAIIYKIGGTKDLIYIQMQWFVDQEARISKLQPIESKNYTFVPNVDDNSVNFIKQGYECLKMLPEFQNVVSVDY